MRIDPQSFLYNHELPYEPLCTTNLVSLLREKTNEAREQQQQRNRKQRFRYLCVKYGYEKSEDLKKDLWEAMIRLQLGGSDPSAAVTFRSERDLAYYAKCKDRYRMKRQDAKEVVACKHQFLNQNE